MSYTFKTALIGLGSVGRNFLKIIERKRLLLADQYGIEVRIVCAADSSGAIANDEGFDPTELRQFKEQGGKVATWRAPTQSASSLLDHLQTIDYNLLLDASPVNLQSGEPGLSAVRCALQRGIPCVLANKGPMVLAYHELHELARQHQTALAFSATVCGSLPVLNIGRRDLVAGEISLLRGIFNATSNYVLGEMEKGRSYDQAIHEAQLAGIAETDPTLDVEGWDTANKLVIIANSFLGVRVGLNDVTVRGITNLNQAQLRAELARGKTIKLVATARRNPHASRANYALSVEPVVLPQSDFLASCSGFEMAIEIHSDLYGIHFYKNLEGDALPTAAAMLRDAIAISSAPRLTPHSPQTADPHAKG